LFRIRIGSLLNWISGSRQATIVIKKRKNEEILYFEELPGGSEAGTSFLEGFYKKHNEFFLFTLFSYCKFVSVLLGKHGSTLYSSSAKLD
jgi:hypothetical protein